MLILRNRDMLALWLGQSLSQGGTRMQQIALAWWIVTSAEGSGTALGLFMVAGALPAIILVKAAGRLVDASSSKRVLVVTDLLSAGLAAVMAWALHAGALSLAWACAGGLVMAGFQAFFDPALNKAVAEVADPADVEEAVAFQSSTQSLASFAGAVAGALLIDKLGIAGVVLLNAASFLASAALNATLGMRHALPRGEAAGGDGLSGWAIVSRLPLVKKVLLGFGCVNFFMTPVLVVLPLYVREVLGGSASQLGFIEAGLWVGLVAGTAASRWKGLSSGSADGGAGVVDLGAKCLAVIGLCLLLPGIVAAAPLFAALLFLAGAALGINNVKFVALFQAAVAPEHKGRFFALMAALVSFTFPAAFFLFGLLSDLLDPKKVCVVQGLGILALAFYFSRLAARTRSAPEEALT
ncbi:MAG: MFS transporter [Elusimicrobia bacterium]|nr:MFS transporter [Elusimicrobiota bacterium]